MPISPGSILTLSTSSWSRWPWCPGKAFRASAAAGTWTCSSRWAPKWTGSTWKQDMDETWVKWVLVDTILADSVLADANVGRHICIDRPFLANNIRCVCWPTLVSQLKYVGHFPSLVWWGLTDKYVMFCIVGQSTVGQFTVDQNGPSAKIASAKCFKAFYGRNSRMFVIG